MHITELALLQNTNSHDAKHGKHHDANVGPNAAVDQRDYAAGAGAAGTQSGGYPPQAGYGNTVRYTHSTRRALHLK